MALAASREGEASKPALALSPFHHGDPNNAIVAAPGAGSRIALTFDDGPLPGPTREVLAFLRRQRTSATFFAVGRRAALHPAIVREQLAAGHELASHTWSHPLLPPLPANAMRAEITRGATALQRITGDRPQFFRPPHGYFDRRVSAAAAALGMGTIGWDIAVDRAATGRSAQAAAAVVLRQVRPGSILLAHDLPRGGPRAIAILSIVLPELRRRGIRVGTVSELLRAAALSDQR